MLASRNPAKIYITGRNEPAAQNVIANIKSTSSNMEVIWIRCDHTELASVKQAAKEISKESRLDILMANAGVMALPPGKKLLQWLAIPQATNITVRLVISWDKY